MNLYVAISCAGAEKLPTLWATLTSLFPKLPSGSFISVSYNSADTKYEDANDGFGIKTLWLLASRYKHTFSIKNKPDSSVAQMFASSAQEAKDLGFTHILKIDDDCIVERLSDCFELAKLTPYVTVNFFDIENTRGYDDWRPEVKVEDYKDMVAQYGERTLWCHNWVGDDDSRYSFTYSAETKVNASVFVFDLEFFTDDLYDQLWSLGKGQRGMDLVVGTYFASRGRTHSFLDLVVHLGVYRPQLDGRYWKTYKEGAEIKHASPVLNADNGRGVKLFVGKEVEHTPYFGQTTLFVQGLVDHRLVLKAIDNRSELSEKIENVYLGAGGLSQLDTSLIKKCLDRNVNVTVESVVMPGDSACVLIDPRVVLVIPVSNEGRYQEGAKAAVCSWFAAYSDGGQLSFDSLQVYFKIDTAAPEVLIFSIKSALGLTQPEAYKGDVPLVSRIEDCDEHVWID